MEILTVISVTISLFLTFRCTPFQVFTTVTSTSLILVQAAALVVLAQRSMSTTRNNLFTDKSKKINRFWFKRDMGVQGFCENLDVLSWFKILFSFYIFDSKTIRSVLIDYFCIEDVKQIMKICFYLIFSSLFYFSVLKNFYIENLHDPFWHNVAGWGRCWVAKGNCAVTSKRCDTKVALSRAENWRKNFYQKFLLGGFFASHWGLNGISSQLTVFSV